MRPTVCAPSGGSWVIWTAGRSVGSACPWRPPPEKPPPWLSAHVRIATPRTAAKASQRRPRAGAGSEAHGLRTPLDLGAAVLAQGVDGTARQVGVAEQPGDALAVVVPAVVEHGEQPGQALHHEPIVV